jgi:hypothetical protein
MEAAGERWRSHQTRGAARMGKVEHELSRSYNYRFHQKKLTET